MRPVWENNLFCSFFLYFEKTSILATTVANTGICTGTKTATDKQWKLMMILSCGYKDYSAVATR